MTGDKSEARGTAEAYFAVEEKNGSADFADLRGFLAPESVKSEQSADDPGFSQRRKDRQGQRGFRHGLLCGLGMLGERQ